MMRKQRVHENPEFSITALIITSTCRSKSGGGGLDLSVGGVPVNKSGCCVDGERCGKHSEGYSSREI
jgi:hypothetical protein